MEPFPMHMKGPLVNIGDMALTSKFDADTPIFHYTQPTPVSYSKTGTLVNFFPSGTGFIISIKEINLKGTLQKFALVLTAAHVVGDVIDDKYTTDGDCKLENHKFRKYYFIKRFVGESRDSYISKFTNYNYCVNGDVAMVLIKLKMSDFPEFYELSTITTHQSICCVSGYPKKPADFSYVIPQIDSSDQSELEKKANEIFCNFKGHVYSEGKVESDLNGIIEISCSTTNGMSGSPILIDKKVVGIYVGGPPNPGQRELVEILQRLSRKEDLRMILEDIDWLKKFDGLYNYNVFANICNTGYFKEAQIITMIKERRKLTNDEQTVSDYLLKLSDLDRHLKKCVFSLKNIVLCSISLLVMAFTEKQKYKANVGISTKCDIFRGIFQRIDMFNNLTHVNSKKDIIRSLS